MVLATPAEYRLDTLSIHAGQGPNAEHGAVMQPIVLASTFAQDGPGNTRKTAQAPHGYEYSRSGNPTRQALEACVAALEGAQYGFAFASGSAAMATFLHTLQPGDHVLSGDDVYGGTFRLFDKVMRPKGIASTFLDLRDPERLRSAVTARTKLLWLETPTNPMLKVFDIAKLAEVAHALGLTVVVDNTFATPIAQRPLQLGADVVVHSTTKYLNGHSDVVGGALVTNDAALAERVGFLQNAIGAIPAPFDCYMVLRGLKTLGVRVRAQSASALTLAERLEKHPRVEKVIYPGLSSHPDHRVAKAQMAVFGGMISLVLRGGLPAATHLLRQTRLFTCAESLGGVESLAEHPAVMTHASIPADQRAALGIADGLVRLSVGLEDVEDLWQDLRSGLESAP